MRITLVAVSFCALFALALVTVRVKTREVLLRYEIAELEKYESLLFERILYLKAEVERKAGIIGLLDKAVERGILLHMGSPNGMEIPLLSSMEERVPLE
jgi:hypothetical protein